MEFFRTAPNPWGQEVLVGVAWDLMWFAIIASAMFVVGHTLWMRGRKAAAAESAAATGDGSPAGGDEGAGIPDQVERHGFVARAFHWLMAIAMFGLLITAFVPVLGLQFAWVELHWMAGLVLVAAIVFHIVHSTVFQDFWSMWVKAEDLGNGMEELKHSLGAGEGAAPKAGKYPFDHQLYHHLAAVTTLTAMVTGLLMMVRVENPFLAQNPYLLSDGVWGIVYVLHGLAGVSLIGLIAAHIYFAVRPEKRWMTWGMIRGWITRDDYLAHYDPEKWSVGSSDPTQKGVTGD